jgi:hypothetical protein
MSGAVYPLLQYAFIVWCSVKKKYREGPKLSGRIGIEWNVSVSGL